MDLIKIVVYVDGAGGVTYLILFSIYHDSLESPPVMKKCLIYVSEKNRNCF
jgi:hypothetical protein